MINLKTIHYNSIQETLYHHTLPNGLSIYLLPKKGFTKTYVTLSTPLGSNVEEYTVNGEKRTLPEGIAHFLEHKLFEKDGKDISEVFALHHAQVNAYTMNNRTTYLFSCTDDLTINIQSLFDLVFHPTFTEEGINKEIGIIEQEIKMYQDDPNTKIYMGLIRNLFLHHPVKNEILGTVASLKTITVDLLNDVHQAFYNPSNMILFVTGNIEVASLIKTIEEIAPDIPKMNISLHLEEEALQINEKHEEDSHDIIIPNVLLGIKHSGINYSKQNVLKQELTYSILFDLLIGKSTPTYQSLLEKELVNDSFGLDITLEETYGFFLFGGNTTKPDQFYIELKDILQNAYQQTFDESHFERTKRSILGGFITALNSLEYIANQFTKFHFQHTSLFDLLDIAKTITLEDVKEAALQIQDPTLYSSFTIFPKKKR
jgi:predicted Zn-dependent peptidase